MTLGARWNNVNRLLYRVSHSLDSYLEPTYLPIEFMWEKIVDPFSNSPPVPAGAYETRFPPFPYVTRYTSYRRAQYPDETQRESIGGSWIVGQHAHGSSHINAPSFIRCTFFLSRSSTNWAFRIESFYIQSPNYIQARCCRTSWRLNSLSPANHSDWKIIRRYFLKNNKIK